MKPFIDTNVIFEPGVYPDIPMAQYQADPCPEPSLSSHVAALLIARSPLHAWHAHPRLNPNYTEKESEKFDIGAAAHALLLEGEDRMAPLPFDDWRKKDAREARDAARNAGKYPVLQHRYDDVRRMRDVAVKAIAGNKDFSGMTLADGKPEQTMIWKEAGIYLRARPDWISNDRQLRLDYKTTEGSANANAWERTMLGMGADMQDAFYAEGNAATGGPEDGGIGVFLVQEVQEPFVCSFIALDPGFRAIAHAKVMKAKRIWRECLKTGIWPGYPDRICYLEPPSWLMAQYEEIGPGEDEALGIPYDPAKLFVKL